MRITLALLSFCFLFFTSCREDIEELTIDTTIPDPVITIGTGEIQLRGRIVNENGTPLQDVLIANIGGNTRSDENGNYTLPAVETQPDGAAFFYISKENYFEEYRQIYPGPASINMLDIVMQSSLADGAVNGETGGTYETSEGVKLVIPAGAALSAGQPYFGDIGIKIAYESPTSYADIEQSSSNIPAWFNGELVELATYGMAQVRLETEEGARVYFPQDQPANLQMPLPGSLARFTDTMRFWQLQEQIWFPQGQASNINGSLSANIFDSGYYNCDIPYPRATICGTLVDDMGMILPDQPFALVIDNGAFVFNTRTNERGQFCVQVARDQVLRIRIPDPCAPEETLFEVTVGPFPEGPSQIGNVAIDVITARKPVSLTDCNDGTPITQDQGLLWISGFGGGYPVRTNNAGLANLLLPDCGGGGSSFEVQAVANDQRRTSPLTIINSEDLSLLDLEICSELEADEEFLVNIVGVGAFPMDEVSYLLIQNQNGSLAHQFWGQSSIDGDTTEFFVTLPDLAEADYDVAARVFRYEPGLRSSYLCDGCPDARVTVYEVGPNQSYIKGSISFRAVHRNLDTGEEIANPIVIIGDFTINR